MISITINSITNVSDKAGSLGTLTAAMGCVSCFPALGSLASSIGMGFLAQYEGIFINTLLPLFAAIVLASHVISFFSHKCWYRGVAGISGPTMVLLTLYPLWFYNWSTYLLYVGIALMLIVAIWDIVYPARKTCNITLATNKNEKMA